ncbi:MAG: type IV pilus biogenesis/stability protein PilW [Proteobacteria bacterium]|nr:type IV pilus biogenesis/stability protein PilW [Pseudomonadota bacterium]MDE3208922.1 type IV pilus biogenesis/stability protein PilW [Pseudomonadota bacterium]
MRNWLISIVLLILSGCVTSGTNQLQAQEKGPAYRAKLHTELGATYYSRGQYIVALKELKTALSDDSSYAPAYEVLGLVYFHFKENEKARQSFIKALSITPNNPGLLNNYGWFVCHTGSPAKAMPYFRRAWDNPLYATPEKAFDNAAFCSLKQGKTRIALGYFEQALHVQPQDVLATYQLALLYFNEADYKNSQIFLNRLFRLAGNTPQGLLLQVRLAHRKHELDEQKRFALKLIHKFPDSPQAQVVQQKYGIN